MQRVPVFWGEKFKINSTSLYQSLFNTCIESLPGYGIDSYECVYKEYHSETLDGGFHSSLIATNIISFCFESIFP